MKMIDYIKNINIDFIKSVTRRDLRRYFSNPSGYVFITLFIFLSATAAFWQERFFMNNLANLDQLNMLFPLLLVFFIPAITMGVWAEERKMGTDELLLTLPATDLEIVLGKYIAVLGIYTASLILSFSHVLVLFWLGSPDLGLMLGNFLGYWFAGAALIAVGMLASMLTSNATISFIVGALFCSVFIFIDSTTAFLGSLLAPLSIVTSFGDFARGIISFSSLFYFISLVGMMVYFNVVVLSRRHWPVEADGIKIWAHHVVRGIALVVIVISLNVIFGRISFISFRLDVTAEQLHSLSGETENLLDELPDNKPVLIQAFISKDVPQAYAQTRSNLLGFLKEIDAEAGGKVQVLIHETEPYTEESKDAREKFGITSREIPNVTSATSSVAQVFMGVAFTSGAEEEVIPFFDRGLPVEYELTRSIRTVVKSERKKIGIVNTKVKLFGGFDFQTMNSTPAWPVVEELKKQYEVVQISAEQPITEEVDGLLAVLPSSLSQPEMDNLKNYIEAGNPTLLLVDPLPVIDISLAPLEKAGAQQNPFQQQRGPQPKPKGNINKFMTDLGVSWNTGAINWDGYNPHPDLAQIQPEIIFVGEGNKNPNAFNQENAVSSGLQELVLLYPGNIQQTGGNFEFESLLQSSKVSGSIPYQQLVRKSFFGAQLARGMRHIPDSREYTLAAKITGAKAIEGATEANEKSLNMIVIADIDFISQQFFEMRQRGFENLNFDNVTFFLNCMDMMAGDNSFIDLRKRRVKHRTLQAVESRMQEHVQIRAQQEQEAGMEAQMEMQKAQQRLTEKVNEVKQRTDLDERTKGIMANNIQKVEQKKFDAMKNSIEEKQKMKIQSSKEEMEAQVRSIQNTIKLFAVMAPPIPVFFLGVWIFFQRRKREKEGAIVARRLRS